MNEIYLSPFLGWLLRSSWQAGILILLVLAVQRLFRRQLSQKWRYRLWLLVLLRLVLPVSLPSPLSVFNLTPAGLPEILTSNQTASAPHETVDFLPPASPLSAAPAASPGPMRPSAAKRTTDNARPGKVGQGQGSVQPGEYTGWRLIWLGLGDYPVLARGLLFLVLVIWPAGVIYHVVRIARQNVGFVLRVQRAPPMTNPEVLLAFEDCKRLLDIDFPIELVETAEVEGPALYGLIRPRLLLPQGMADSFSLQELNFVFLHELAHVKRLDMAVNWLMSVLQILHWFNPLIRHAFARIRSDRELACDALALSKVREAETVQYGLTIIKLLENLIRPPRVSGLVGLLEEKEQMKRRILMIAGFKRVYQMPVLGALLMLLLGFAGLTDAKIPEPRLDGLVGWWRGEENARDAAGNAHGLPEGEVRFEPGKFGKAFRFDGLEGALKISASPALDVGHGNGFAVAAWIKLDRTDAESPILEWNSGLGGVGFWAISDYGAGALYAEMTDEKNVKHTLTSPASVLKQDVFQHVVMTYSRINGAATLYVNGKMVALNFVGMFTPITDGDVYIGLSSYGENAGIRFAGLMDEIQIFNHSLSAREVDAIYQDGSHGQLPRIELATNR